MGYVDDNLMPGERVIYRAKIHWTIYLPASIVAAIGIYVMSGEQGDLSAAGFVVLILGAIGLVSSFITQKTTELAVTSKRVIAKFGLIRRNTIELSHAKVESLGVDQGLLGRILGAGTVTIHGTGGGKTPIPNIDDPLQFRRHAMQTFDQA